jgi:hypothetical protein
LTSRWLMGEYVHIFKHKIPIWVNFGVSYNGRCRCILCPFDVFYGHLVYFVAIYVVYFMVIWYIFPVWVYCPKKNMATLSWLCRGSSRYHYVHSMYTITSNLKNWPQYGAPIMPGNYWLG